GNRRAGWDGRRSCPTRRRARRWRCAARADGRNSRTHGLRRYRSTRLRCPAGRYLWRRDRPAGAGQQALPAPPAAACPGGCIDLAGAMPRSAVQLLLEQLIDLLRVGLAPGRLHRLADEEADHLAALGLVTGTVLFDLGRVGCQHFIEHGLDGAGIGHLLEPACLNDLVGVTFTVGHGLEHHLGDLAGDGVVPDAQDHAAQLLGADRRLVDLDVRLVQQAGQLAHHPVGRQLGVAAGALDLLEVVGHLAAGREHAGIVGGQAELALEAFALLLRQFRQLAADLFAEGRPDDHRQQVRGGEVAVVVGLFLAAHGAGFVLVRIVQAGFLNHRAAILDQLDLTLHLGIDSPFDEAEGVDVLQLAAGAELGLALGPYRHVAVAAEGALGHVAVADRS